MATGVGLRIGNAECVAAVVTTGCESEPEFVTREAVLHLSDGGDAVLGGPAPTGYHSVTGFAAKVGDPNGIPVDAGPAYRAEDLVATAVFCMINIVAEQLSPPTEIYATFPPSWPGGGVDALREALDYLGLRSVTLLSADEAAVLPGEEPAHGAALTAYAAALATSSGHDARIGVVTTDSFAGSSGPVVGALAYSAVEPAAQPPVIPFTPVAGGAAADAGSAPVAELPVTQPVPPKRRPIPALLGALAAAAILLGGGVAVVLGNTAASTDAPPLPPVEAAPSTTTTVPPAPIAFPTEVPLPPPAVRPVDLTTPPPPPAPRQVTTPAPPPPPPAVVTTTPPPPPPPPSTTRPPRTTTATTESTTEPSTPPTPSTEPTTTTAVPTPPSTTTQRRLPFDNPLPLPTLFPQVERPR